MIHIEVKHDIKHRKWHRLSVGFHHGIVKHPTALYNWMIEYMMNYAVDRQMNSNQIACRAVNDGKVIMQRDSNATMNRGDHVVNGQCLTESEFNQLIGKA